MACCTTADVTNEKKITATYETNDEWATYEGRWMSQDGVVNLELSLQVGSYGYDSNYKLNESFISSALASGGPSSGKYSTKYDTKTKQLYITIKNLNKLSRGGFLHYENKLDGQSTEEMYFITRGENELIPCDNNFKPLTEDKRYTLHKRSKLFTVEGYITFEEDSATFFERNTFEYWKVAQLGEFSDLKDSYQRLAKEKDEGIYVRGLAYSIKDEEVSEKTDFLVIKRAASIGNDPEDN